MRPVVFFPRVTIVDCGASRTTLAVFSGRRAGGLRLEHYASESHVIEAGQEGRWLEKTAAAVQSLRARINAAGPVTLVLPPHLTLMKMFSTPRVKTAQRDKIINFESQQSIPYPLGEVVWDRLIAGESAYAFNVLLCAAKRDVVDPLCAAMTAAGLTPSVLLPSALALAGGLRRIQANFPAPTLLVNLGARSTTLLLLDKDGFQARSLSWGGNNFAQLLAEEKTTATVDAGEPTVGQAVRLFANRLAQEIARTRIHFQQQGTAGDPGQLWLAGGVSRLPGLAELLASQVALPVSVIDPMQAFEVGSAASDFKPAEDGPAFLDLLGAAAARFEAKPAGFNLLPSPLRHQAGRRRLRPWLAAAAGLAVAWFVPSLLHQRQLLADVREQNLVLEREMGPLRASAARASEIRQQWAAAQRQQEAWLKVTASRTAWIRFLDELQSKFARVEGGWIERLQPMPVSSANGAEPAGQPLKMAFSGLLPNPGGDEALLRIRGLLEEIATIPWVASVGNERFEPASGGLLRFDFVVVLKDVPAL